MIRSKKIFRKDVTDELVKIFEEYAKKQSLSINKKLLEEPMIVEVKIPVANSYIFNLVGVDLNSESSAIIIAFATFNKNSGHLVFYDEEGIRFSVFKGIEILDLEGR